jgi:hypothetical protein
VLAADTALPEVEALREALEDVRRRAVIGHGHEAAGASAVEIDRRALARHELDGQPADAVEHAAQVEAVDLQQGLGQAALALEVRHPGVEVGRLLGRHCGGRNGARAMPSGGVLAATPGGLRRPRAPAALSGS